MLTTIARKEFTETIRDGRFRLMAFVLSALFVAATLVSWHYYRNVSGQHQDGRNTARQQWESQGAKNPHGAAHYGTYAFKPIHALSLIDNGLDKFVGVSVFLEAHAQNFDRFKTIEDQNPLARFGELTPAFVLVYLLPLLIILISFSSISAEKEMGMWQLMLSQGARPRQLAAGKVLGVWAVLATLLVPFFALGLAFLAFSPDTEPEEYGRYALICGVLLVYYGTFIHVSVWFSGRVRKSTVALVGLVAFWLASSLLVPRMATNVAEYLYPVPSLAEYQKSLDKDLENGIDGHDPYNDYSKKLEANVLKQHGVDSVQKLPFNWWGFVMQKGEEHEKYVFDKHMGQLQQTYRNQLAVHRAASLLSPASLVRNLSMSLARTDIESHNDFKRQAENYRIRLVGNLNKDLEVNSKYDDWNYKSDAAFFARTDKFNYQPTSLRSTLGFGWPSLCLLAGWFFLSFLGVWLTKK